MKQFFLYFACPVCGHKTISQWDSIHGTSCDKCGKFLNEPNAIAELPANGKSKYDIKLEGTMYPSMRKAKKSGYKFS